MKQAYQCIDCGHEFDVENKKTDGTRCPKCNGGLLPIPRVGYYCKECGTRPAVCEEGICDRCGMG